MNKSVFVIPYIYILLLLLTSMPLAAEQTNKDFIHGRHSLRIGWGDAFLSTSNYRFEPLYGMTFAPVYPSDIQPALDYVVGMPAAQADAFLRDYRWVELGEMQTTGHFFLGYNYQLTPLISIGVQVDYLYMSLPMQWYNGYHTPLEGHAKDELHHLTLMPNIRFVFYRQRVLSLYSALGVGYSFYGFSEDHLPGVSLNLTALGINVGGEHWFAEAELGSFQSWNISAVSNGLYGSRLFSLAVGYRF